MVVPTANVEEDNGEQKDVDVGGDQYGTIALPSERVYEPTCSEDVLQRIGMRPGVVADMISN